MCSARAIYRFRWAPPGRVAELTTGESGLAASILDLYERAGLEPPSPLEVARRLQAKPPIVEGLVKHRVSRKRLVRLPGDRNRIRWHASQLALDELRRHLQAGRTP